ncbi:MAG TPA: ABC transporter permease [Dehalococcoidia bacterium]|jgi:peptide/nickel transport system permease protein|nr:ABC transporter permease [Dehalococcoidia bacterium]
MLRYTLRRLSWLPIILFGVSLIAFVVLRTLPGQDPATAIAGQGATPEQIQQLRDQLGLERPIFPISVTRTAVVVPAFHVHAHSQYSEWIGNLVRGDFSREFYSKKPIRDEFKRRFFPSFELVAMSLSISAVIGIAFGILSAVYRNSWLDYVVRLTAVIGASVPEFFLLTLLIVIPSRVWNYSMPVGGYVAPWEDLGRNLRLFVPAALVLGFAGSAGLMRLVRTTMLEVLRADYVRTARAKGLSGRVVVLEHALRNSATPILTALGTSFVAIFGGSVIAEVILSIQGLGLWFFTAAQQRDLTVIQFLVVYTAFVVVIVNLIVDLSYAWLDPRVRYN